MEFRESETVELKRGYIDDIRKEIIAMCNCSGGTIYIGVDDDGSVVGVEDCDGTIQRITNTVRDSIKPDITMFLRYDTLTVNGKEIVSVAVQSGTNRPYYLAAKGLRPEGVFVRQGTSSVSASDAAIRQMIKETDGDNYEDMRSLNQNLTFDEASKVFAARKLDFGPQQMRTLGLVSADGVYTNLGLLLSDQCPHIIKGATFNGTDQQEFQDRQEFAGSLLKQLHDAYAYMSLRNQTHATFDGIYRQDRKDYPETALREALLNAIVHRDYSFAASTLVSIYADRMELISIGGLIHGVSLDDVLLGLSVCHNQKLANIFYRLELIEAYGTGIQKIHSAYRKCSVLPEIIATGNAFKVVLPKMAAATTVNPGNRQDDVGLVLSHIREHGLIVRQEVEALLGIKTSAANRLLKRMMEDKLIAVAGKGKNTQYVERK